MRKPYHGWVVVGAAGGILSVAFGVWFSFSAFVDPIARSEGWSRTSVLATFSITGLVYGLSGPLVGRVIERFGVKRAYAIGAALLCGGLAASAAASHLAIFYLTYAVVAGLGISFLGGLTGATLVQRWFERRRGTAQGIVIAGNGIGILLMVPLARALINGLGWRSAYLVIAGLAAVLLVPLQWFVREGPAPGEREEAEARSLRGAARLLVVRDEDWAARLWDLRSAVRTTRFWALCATAMLGATATQSVLSQQVSIIESGGFGGAVVGVAAGAVGLVSILAKPAWGWMSDHGGRELIFTTASLFLVTGLLAGTVLDGASMAGLVAYVVFLGIGYSVHGPLFPAIAGDLFAGKHFASVYGVVSMAIGAGVAAGPLVGGWLAERGDFDPVMMFAAACAAGSMLTVWAAAPRLVRAREGSR